MKTLLYLYRNQTNLKHINELINAIDDGFEAYVVFIIQMKNIEYFTPNYKTHKDFGDALKLAQSRGVNIIAIDCEVTEDSIEASEFVEVRFKKHFWYDAISAIYYYY